MEGGEGEVAAVFCSEQHRRGRCLGWSLHDEWEFPGETGPGRRGCTWRGTAHPSAGERVEGRTPHHRFYSLYLSKLLVMTGTGMQF